VPRTIAIVQARMGSTRLPGKILLPIEGRTLLERVIDRARRASTIDEVVVATTHQRADDDIVALGARAGFAVERGDENDLLDRYVSAARAKRADVVLRITSDCPLLDPEVIDRIVEEGRERGADYASNVIEPRTWPRGLDAEAVTMDALERAWREDDRPDWREHVTPYFYRNPERFRLHPVYADQDYSRHRWCVDTPEDLDLITRIYRELGRDEFSWRDVLAIVESHPGWADLNREVHQKPVLPR
jgi:spore coat polysaccharide biosynthesis protein SpsF